MCVTGLEIEATLLDGDITQELGCKTRGDATMESSTLLQAWRTLDITEQTTLLLQLRWPSLQQQCHNWRVYKGLAEHKIGPTLNLLSYFYCRSKAHLVTQAAWQGRSVFIVDHHHPQSTLLLMRKQIASEKKVTLVQACISRRNKELNMNIKWVAVPDHV